MPPRAGVHTRRVLTLFRETSLTSNAAPTLEVQNEPAASVKSSTAVRGKSPQLFGACNFRHLPRVSPPPCNRGYPNDLEHVAVGLIFGAPGSFAYLLVLVGEDGSARLDLGVQHVGVVYAHEDLEVCLHRHLCYRVDDRALRPGGHGRRQRERRSTNGTYERTAHPVHAGVKQQTDPVRNFMSRRINTGETTVANHDSEAYTLSGIYITTDKYGRDCFSKAYESQAYTRA